MDFSNSLTLKTRKNIERLIHIWKSDDCFELEAKHCLIKTTDNYGEIVFKNGTTAKNANYIKNLFESIKNHPMNKFEFHKTIDKFYKTKNSSGVIRETFNKETKEKKLILKTRVEQIDVNYFLDGFHFSNIRFTLSKENPIDAIPKGAIQKEKIRLKNRQSLITDQQFRLDLTAIKSQAESKDFEKEFEIEFFRSEKTLNMPSIKMAEIVMQLIINSFEIKPSFRAVFSIAFNLNFLSQNAIFLVKTQKNGNLGLFCKAEENSKKLAFVADLTKENDKKFNEIFKKENKNYLICKFYYNPISSDWEQSGPPNKNGNPIKIFELIELMESRVGF